MSVFIRGNKNIVTINTSRFIRTQSDQLSSSKAFI